MSHKSKTKTESSKLPGLPLLELARHELKLCSSQCRAIAGMIRALGSSEFRLWSSELRDAEASGLGASGGGVPNQAFTIVYDVYAGIVVCTMWNFQLVSPGF